VLLVAHAARTRHTLFILHARDALIGNPCISVFGDQ
jgi:hypothetical protein